MITVFLSYATRDHFFADLATIKLAESKIQLWRDLRQLRAGTDWRHGIERGIAECVAVLVALSPDSAESSYVTYEWAYALGKGKPVIPLKLQACPVHPKLETIQYLDFSVPGTLPWASLAERIREIEPEASAAPALALESVIREEDKPDRHVHAILAYLNERGYQMASFERLRQEIDENLTDEDCRQLIENNRTTFREATIRGGKEGLAKVVP